MNTDKTFSQLNNQFSASENKDNLTASSTLIYRQASEISIKPINWLWGNRFAKGKLSIIAGEPGLGKSQLSISMAAKITTGQAWPDGENCGLGEVIFLSAEDDAADTIVPRLKAAGANLSRVHIIDAVKDDKETLNQFNLVSDLKSLEDMITKKDNISAIFIDPISSYMGTHIDDHKNTSVRAALTPLSKLAEKHNIAIICISHLNKSSNQKALHRVIGSIGYIAAARAAFVVVRDENEEDKRLLIPLKNNIGNDKTGLAFKIESHQLENNIKTSRILWLNETITTTADEVISLQDQPVDKSSIEEAEEFLCALLADGGKPANDIKKLAESEMISDRTLRRAKSKLSITVQREGFGKGSKSLWYLPIKESQTPIHGHSSHTCPPENMANYKENGHVWQSETNSIIDREVF